MRVCANVTVLAVPCVILSVGMLFKTRESGAGKCDMVMIVRTLENGDVKAGCSLDRLK
jgi:hypothetical protein